MKRWKVTAPDERVYFVYANSISEREARLDAAKVATPRIAERAGTYDSARNVVIGGDE